MSTFLSETSSEILSLEAALAAKERELDAARRRASVLQGLVVTALSLNSSLSLDEILRIGAEQAARIIGVRQVGCCVAEAQSWDDGVKAAYLAERHAAWQEHYAKALTDPAFVELYRLVCDANRSARLSIAELATHPHACSLCEANELRPALIGWLGAPLVGRDGRNIGLLHVSEREEGHFTGEDEALCVQIAQILSVAISNYRLYEEVREADRRKDEFLAVLSHELRSPLNVISGHAQLLHLEEPGSEEFLQSLEAIERNVAAQTQLIADLLDVSRIVTGKLKLDISSFAVWPMVEAAVDSVRFAAEAKGVSLIVQAAGDLGQMSGEARRLQQVLWNLLSNAVKFTEAGGQIILSVARSESAIEFQVQDSGLGISAEFLPHVFDRFQQEDASKTRKYGGLGLGLSIVRHITELHGGWVWVESEGKGKGATFTVVIPARVEASKTTTLSAPKLHEPKREPLPARVEGPLEGHAILVVEDQADARLLVARILTKAGATVTAVASGFEALTLFSTRPWDFLVCDIGMPEMSGYELVRQWRARQGYQAKIPAVALTAYASEQDRREALAAGFQAYLAKPLKLDDLLAALLRIEPSRHKAKGASAD